MQEYELRVGGLSCGSCERIVQRAVMKTGAHVVGFDFNRGALRVSCHAQELPKVLGTLAEKGFHARLWAEEEFEVEGLRKFISLVLKGDARFRFERELLTITALVLVVSMALNLFVVSFLATPEASKALPFMGFGSVGIALGLFSIGHIRPYGRQTCQTGMMLGMGVGMMLGFLVGALFGATNGMFTGSVLGMVVGMGLGAWIGRCCGAMGVLEGLMGGLMAGTMGAMLTVMLFDDHQFEFMVFLWAVCAVILGLLSYMLFEENGLAPKTARVGIWKFLLLGVLLTLAVDYLLLFGPKSPLAGGL